MVRDHCGPAAGQGCSPHPRGDGPLGEECVELCVGFSPPAWGWSAPMFLKSALTLVLPTRVGMVRTRAWVRRAVVRSPHPRGDGPELALVEMGLVKFSPPAWGWSETGADDRRLPVVLPTRVGMVRSTGNRRSPRRSSPHPRGDGPISFSRPPSAKPFSPPAWGWSGVPVPMPRGVVVLPTRVGMVRRSSRLCRAPARSPHPRGDGPGHE